MQDVATAESSNALHVVHNSSVLRQVVHVKLSNGTLRYLWNAGYW